MSGEFHILHTIFPHYKYQKLQDYGHIMLKSPEVSNVKPQQYLERLTAWDYHLRYAGDIMDNISELVIGKPRLNSLSVHYIYLHANALEKSTNPSRRPLSMV